MTMYYFTVVRPTYQVHHEWWQNVKGTFAKSYRQARYNIFLI